jgi:hypothetical protein
MKEHMRAHANNMKRDIPHFNFDFGNLFDDDFDVFSTEFNDITNNDHTSESDGSPKKKTEKRKGNIVETQYCK